MAVCMKHLEEKLCLPFIVKVDTFRCQRWGKCLPMISFNKPNAPMCLPFSSAELSCDNWSGLY